MLQRLDRVPGQSLNGEAAEAARALVIRLAVRARLGLSNDRAATYAPRLGVPRLGVSRASRIPAARMWTAITAGACLAALVIGGISRSPLVREHSTARAANATRYATHVSQQATITLTDGSRVTLAPQTTLRIESGFGGRTRTVALSGEAYFDVRTGSVPFIVRTGQFDTHVLGTTFNVRRYPTDWGVRVAVTSGKVNVTTRTTSHASITLAAGAVGHVDDSTAVLVSRDSAQQYTSWTAGQLVFRDAPTQEVLTTLTRWYGYRFQVADSLLTTRNLTAVLDAHSWANALSTLKLLLNVDLTFEGDVVTLHLRQTRRPPSNRPRGTGGIEGTIITPHTEVGR